MKDCWNDRLSCVLFGLESSGKCVITAGFPEVSLFNIMFRHTAGTVPDRKCKWGGSGPTANAEVNHANLMQFLVFRERFELKSRAHIDLKCLLQSAVWFFLKFKFENREGAFEAHVDWTSIYTC